MTHAERQRRIAANKKADARRATAKTGRVSRLHESIADIERQALDEMRSGLPTRMSPSAPVDFEQLGFAPPPTPTPTPGRASRGLPVMNTPNPWAGMRGKLGGAATVARPIAGVAADATLGSIGKSGLSKVANALGKPLASLAAFASANPLMAVGSILSLPWIIDSWVDLYKKMTGTDLETLQFKEEQRGRKMDMLAGAMMMSEDAANKRTARSEQLHRDTMQSMDIGTMMKLQAGSPAVGGIVSGDAAARDDEATRLAMLMSQGGPRGMQSTGDPYIDEGIL